MCLLIDPRECYLSPGDDSVGADRPLVYKRVECCCYCKHAVACTTFDSIQSPGVGLALIRASAFTAASLASFSFLLYSSDFKKKEQWSGKGFGQNDD